MKLLAAVIVSAGALAFAQGGSKGEQKALTDSLRLQAELRSELKDAVDRVSELEARLARLEARLDKHRHPTGVGPSGPPTDTLREP